MNETTLIFDGDCGFCTTAADYVVKHSKHPIHALPWQFIDVTEYGLTKAETAAKVWVVARGYRYGGHEAFARILIVQGNPVLTALGHIMCVPPISWLASLGYLLVARYRHKLPGGTPACKLPS